MKAWLGIDVGKDQLELCLLSEGGSEHSRVENTRKGYNQIAHWLKKRRVEEVRVCLEATGVYGLEVAQYLHDKGHWVSVVNPARVKGYAESQMRRSKTDKLDAAVIAAFCRALEPERWTPPEASWYELRAMVRHLEDLQQVRQQQVNRLEATTVVEIRQQLEAHIAFIDQQIGEVKEQIKAHLHRHPDLKQQVTLLTSIPGIGDLTAWRLLAEIQAWQQFDDVRQVVAYVGLDPTRHESGRSVRGSRQISRQGCAALRAALYLPAVVAKKHNPILRSFAQRLESRGKLPKQIVVAVMRKLLHLAYGILRSGRPFDPHHANALAVSA